MVWWSSHQLLVQEVRSSNLGGGDNYFFFFSFSDRKNPKKVETSQYKIIRSDFKREQLGTFALYLILILYIQL